MEDIPNKVREAMGIAVDVKLLEKDGLPYIEIDVPAYPVGIICKSIYYYRSGSTRQKLSGPALDTFLLRRRGVSWDNMPFPSFRMENVDDGEVERFRKIAGKRRRIDPHLLDEPKEVLLRKLPLINNGYLTNAAMLLFVKDPQDFQQGAYIRVGYF